MSEISQARLKEFFVYDEMSGLLTWKKLPAPCRVKVGDVAGTLRTDGYWGIRLKEKVFLAHRLAWLYAHGMMPTGQIDHINGIRTDNRLANLRLATHAENQRNSKPRKSASGLKGAHLDKSRLDAGGIHPWVSGIFKDGKRLHLGCFATPEEAHAAYVKAAAELHGDFARTA